MMYYVVSIQFNKEAMAENRTVPKSYGNRNDAIREFHRQLSADMGNSAIGWSICMVINSSLGIEASEKYIADKETVQTVQDSETTNN